MSKTIDEIAHDTGLSRTTVTLTLNGQADQYRISKATQQLVRDYVAKHGYAINHTARSLKLKRSDVVGFVVPDLANAFFARLMAALEAHCRDAGLVLVTTSTHEDPDVERKAIENLRSRGVDGIILAPCSAASQKLAPARKRRTPLVIIDRVYHRDGTPTVASDHLGNAEIITSELLTLAHGDVAFLAGHEEIPSIQDRIRGFLRACRDAGIADANKRVLAVKDDSVAAGRALMDQLLAGDAAPPAAFLCSSLLVLEGSLQQLKRRFGAIPPGVVIGTFDEHGMLEALSNPVRAMRQDEEALAAVAFRCLKALMEDTPVEDPVHAIPGKLLRFGPR